VLFKGFSFGDYQVRVSGSCSSCITATGAGGAALGVFNLTSEGLPWSNLEDPTRFPATTTKPAGPTGGFEHFEGFGSIGLPGSPFGTGPSLLGGSANFDAFSIYATAGSRTATIEFDLDSFATSDLITLPSGPLYLQVTGATTAPVGVTNLTPGSATPIYSFTTPMTIDFTMALTDTPFSATSGTPSAVPEPAQWALMLLGFAGVGVALRRRGPIPLRRARA
jgi:hypothetical protein